MRTKSYDAPRRDHINGRALQLLGSAFSVFLEDFFGCMRPGKSARVSGMAQGLDFALILAALLILVERFKFQHLFLSTICQSAARATSDEAFRRAGPEYSGHLPRASRKRRGKVTRRKTNGILRRLLGGRRVREAETNSSPGKAKRFRSLDRFFAPREIAAF